MYGMQLLDEWTEGGLQYRLLPAKTLRMARRVDAKPCLEFRDYHNLWTPLGDADAVRALVRRIGSLKNAAAMERILEPPPRLTAEERRSVGLA